MLPLNGYRNTHSNEKTRLAISPHEMIFVNKMVLECFAIFLLLLKSPWECQQKHLVFSVFSLQSRCGNKMQLVTMCFA